MISQCVCYYKCEIISFFMNWISVLFYVSILVLLALLLITWEEFNLEARLAPLPQHPDQGARQDLVHQACTDDDEHTHSLPLSLTYFVEKRLLWCSIFRVNTPAWLQVVTFFDMVATRQIGPPRTRHFQIREQQAIHTVLKAQPVSFAVVRHPFSRLVSAFQDKGVGEEYPELRNKTFSQFLEFLIQQADSCASTNTWDKMDLHWRPYDKICSFCQVNYTVIAKLETFDQDRERILGMVGVHGERGGLEQVQGVDLDIKACRVTRQHFRGVSLKIKDNLRKIYHLDLKMFGYDPYLFD